MNQPGTDKPQAGTLPDRIRRLSTRWVKRGVRAVISGLVGGLCVLVVVFVMYLESRPDLKSWHTATLDAEFTADSPVATFEDYLALEDRLFQQLEERVYQQIDAADEYEVNRYHRGSLSDPGRWPVNWNRTFELSSPEPVAGVLLLHGLSDSPYSLRRIGEDLHARGCWVVGLRIPGHGTAPAGLVDVQWEDMAAAVRIAARHVRDSVGQAPLYVVGYSNGGALAVLYALSALEDETLPMPDGMVLMSPEIGITKMAALAAWQERLGHVLGLEKLSWNAITIEYDPFKYNSFALNAGRQAYELTGEIQARMSRLDATGALKRFPRVLAVQSVVDATVLAPALVEALLNRLAQSKSSHELLLFDINRSARIEPLLDTSPREQMADLLGKNSRRFAMTVVTNESVASRRVVARHWPAGAAETSPTALALAWPEDLYSLSHVAIPFAPNDPLYGSDPEVTAPGIRLGTAALRGERGILRVPAADMLRLRWNPFYSYMGKRIAAFMQLATEDGDHPKHHDRPAGVVSVSQ